jgi:hypothetical protein
MVALTSRPSTGAALSRVMCSGYLEKHRSRALPQLGRDRGRKKEKEFAMVCIGNTYVKGLQYSSVGGFCTRTPLGYLFFHVRSSCSCAFINGQRLTPPPPPRTYVPLAPRNNHFLALQRQPHCSSSRIALVHEPPNALFPD